MKGKVVGFLTSGIDVIMTTFYFTMLALVILLVIIRYFFRTSITGGYEIVRYLFIYTTFLGAAALLGKREHVEIRLLFDKLPVSIQRIIYIASRLLVAGLHGYLLYLSFEWIRMTGDFRTEILRVPMKFVQIILPVACGLAILYELNNILDSLVKKKT